MSLVNKFLLAWLLISVSNVWAERVVTVENLTVDKQIALSKDKAILIMFSASDCPYCVIMENDFLDPMLIKADEIGAIIRKIEIDNPGYIIDFDGQKIAVKDFANKHRIRVTPTLLFFDPAGNEKASRIIGILTRDYLGVYIDRKIELVKYRMKASRVTKIDKIITVGDKANEK